MLKIRLARHGKRNDPHYRIVCIQDHKKNRGEPLEILGYWHPRSGKIKVEKDLIKVWIEKGAKTTKAVEQLIG